MLKTVNPHEDIHKRMIVWFIPDMTLKDDQNSPEEFGNGVQKVYQKCPSNSHIEHCTYAARV
jgi:hypothetical protein